MMGSLRWNGVQSIRARLICLLTDVVMRRMSGPELAESLSVSHPTLKVVYMSGYTGELNGRIGEVLKARGDRCWKAFYPHRPSEYDPTTLG